MANFTECGTLLKSESRKHTNICQIFQEKCLVTSNAVLLSSFTWLNFLTYKGVFPVAEFLGFQERIQIKAQLGVLQILV